MNKFIVSTDAGADLGMDYISKNDIKVISMKYLFREKDSTKEIEYYFGKGESGPSIEEFYAKLKEGAQVKTSLINQEEHLQYFGELIKENKNILHISLSSGLSGTAENAIRAAEEINAANPDSKIIVIDFKGASMGQGLIVSYLADMRNEGKTLEEAAEWAATNILTFCHYFTVDDLGHLRRGGRISGASAFIGTLLKIKPSLHVNNEGKLIPIGKNIGRKKALVTLVENMKKLVEDKKQRVFISHGDCIEDAQFVAQLITEEFGITDITLGCIGPIVGAHSGPGTVALFFRGKHR